MKVVQVTRGFAPNGGISGVAYNLARVFVKHGIDLQTLTLEKFDWRTNRGFGMVTCFNAIKCFQSKTKGYLRLNLAVFAFSVFASIGMYRQRKTAVTISHGDSFNGDVFVAHSCHWAAIHAKWRKGEKRWLFNPMHWFVLAREAYVFRRQRFYYMVALSQTICDEYRHYHGVCEDKIRIIPNGVDVERFDPVHRSTARKIVLAEMNLPEDIFLLAFVGHEFKRKGLGLLIDALPAIMANERKVALVVVGRDDFCVFGQQAIDRGVAGSVHFMGFRSDVENFLAAADLFVFPTDYEAFPLVFLEALASGVPVLATPVSGICAYLQEGHNGFFIKKDPADIAEKVLTLIDDPELLAVMGAWGRATALNLTWEIVGSQYLDLFREISALKSKGVGGC